MQITLMQGILLAIMTIIVGLDFFLEAFFVFRPLWYLHLQVSF